jgi:hypothetical protein
LLDAHLPADVVPLYARRRRRQMGALLEAGTALAAGKRVYFGGTLGRKSFLAGDGCGAPNTPE